MAEIKAQQGVGTVPPQSIERDRNRNSSAVKIRDVIGAGLKHIGPYKRLDNSKQVVALINDVRSVAITSSGLQWKTNMAIQKRQRLRETVERRK